VLRTTSIRRLGALAAAGIATLALFAAATAGGQAGAMATGAHANEPFCKAIIKQTEMFNQFIKGGLADAAGRTKYFSDQKALNATLSKTAPASLAAEVALQTRNANASFDAQLAGDRAKIKASTVPLRSPEHLAASRRMTEYCGVKVSK
jgi:hypothetical protein